MINTIVGLKRWLKKEEERLEMRFDESKIYYEKSSIEGSLLTIRKLKELIE